MFSKEVYEEKIIPTTRVVLGILGVGLFFGASVIMPATPVVVTPVLKYLKKKLDEREDPTDYKFDRNRLHYLLRRLEKQKEVTIKELPDGSTEVKLTEKGRAKCLKMDIGNLEEAFANKKWDGKWRLVFFDVPEKDRLGRDNFRRILNNLKFYQLQKSVYLTPYPCEEEVEFLRRYYGLGTQVQLLTFEKIENDQAYKLYFGLT